MFNIVCHTHNDTYFVGLPGKSTTYKKEKWKYTFDNFNLFKYRHLKEIARGKKYFVYIHMYADILEKFPPTGSEYKINTGYPMPKRIWKDSGNGLVHWIIDYGTEANQLDGVYCYGIDDIVNSFNTVAKNITLITGAGVSNDVITSSMKSAEYNIVTSTELMTGFIKFDKAYHRQNQKKKIYSIIEKKLLPYKSLNYNRVPRQHRTIIVAHQMHHNYTEALYSLGHFPGNSSHSSHWWDWREYFPEYEDTFVKISKSEDIYCAIPEEGDDRFQHIDLQVNLAAKAGWNHSYNSSFQLVTETQPTNIPHPFITEKSVKPFGMIMPFIQSGPYHNIKHLRNYGYHMFDKWIDHSYDNELDDIQRLKMVLAEFDRLYAISKERWAEMLVEMLPDLLHNAHLVNQPSLNTIGSQLVPIFNNFIKDDI